MNTKPSKGEFLLRFAVSTDTRKKAPQGLVLYKNVVCIRTFVEKANCIDFVTRDLISNGGKPNEYLYKRGYISKVIHQLPSSFIQISQSAIINLNYLTGRSAHSLEVGNVILLHIGTKHRNKVEEAINEWLSLWFHPELPFYNTISPSSHTFFLSNKRDSSFQKNLKQSLWFSLAYLKKKSRCTSMKRWAIKPLLIVISCASSPFKRKNSDSSSWDQRSTTGLRGSSLISG